MASVGWAVKPNIYWVNSYAPKFHYEAKLTRILF